MNEEMAIERLFGALISGDRPASRRLVEDCTEAGYPPEGLLTDVLWPTYEMIERMYRSDQLTALSYRLSTRLLRVLVDQVAASLTVTRESGRTVFAVCGPNDADELGAQMAVDLLEAGGFGVTFAGGGVPADELIACVQETKPDVLLLFASAPSDLPETRQIIDRLHEIGACPHTQIVVGGGVFNRAEGLAEEIGADLWASDPLELVERMIHEPERRAEETQRTVGRKRRKAA